MTFRPRKNLHFIQALLLICTVAMSGTAYGQSGPDDSFTISRLFSEGVVLQRNAAVPVWGTAPPGTSVTIAFDSMLQEVEAGSDGTWRGALEPQAAGGPHTLTISAGDRTLDIQDVWFGDVWIASGQSNMEWTVANSADAEHEIRSANDPHIRHFKVPRTWSYDPESTLAGGEWRRTDSSHVGQFSAVGYYFVRSLRTSVDIPVGILNTSWGGSRIEAWLEPDALMMDPEEIARQLNEYKESGEERTNHQPTLLYNKMIHPLLSFPITGFLWYQGESNAGNAEDAGRYAMQFQSLISSWRSAWGNDTAPFLFVSLAGFRAAPLEPGNSNWALLRESQSAALTLPNVGQAITIDIGEADDIHPRNKQDVGLRLALAARRLAYGEDLVYSGPLYRDHVVEGARVILSFDHTGSGLVARGSSQPGGFAIAGVDGRFVWADARIEGNTVVVSSDSVKNPVAVRYAWADNPDRANLYNQEGLPAAPFRTDP